VPFFVYEERLRLSNVIRLPAKALSKMSFNWDNIDSREQKARREARELKEYLTAQHEETKQRFVSALTEKTATRKVSGKRNV
jgi:hypothetical protein